jgi:ABC-type nitrate/sulfonate/bicarbonate transport system substrate-binding protein
MRTTRNLMLGTLACAAMFGTMSAARAQTHLKVMVFPGLSNFSIFAAEHKNLFAKHGLAVEFLNTPNSDVLRNGLAKGDHQIAHAAVDNAVGGTTARLEAMTKDKANAAAAVLNPPFTFRASEAGLKDMGTATKAIGAYQSDGAFVMRDWAKANSDALVRYISAYVEGRRWALDPANKAEAIALLSERLKLTPQVAALAYAVATDPAEGMAKDAKFDMAGFANVLKLRAEIEGQWGGKPPAPEKYVDLSYYDRALSGLR